MKVIDLFEDLLEDFAGIAMLMKHGKLTRDKATELSAFLKRIQLRVGNRQVPARLRWVEDKKSGTLKFVSADIPGSWKSGPAAAGRYSICRVLEKAGFSVARFPEGAVKRQQNNHNGPHIYFWGPGTPPPKESVNEVFNTPTIWDVITNEPDLFETKLRLPGKVVVFSAVAESDEDGRPKDWDLAFATNVSGKGFTHRATGTGDEMEIFSFVKQSIKQLLKSRHVNYISFSAHKGDRSRPGIYRRLMRDSLGPEFQQVPAEQFQHDTNQYFRYERIKK